MALGDDAGMFYLYVLQHLDDGERFYVGYSSDLQKRVRSHQEGANPSTKSGRWRLVYFEAYLTERAARDRERVLKQDGRVKRFLLDRIKKHL